MSSDPMNRILEPQCPIVRRHRNSCTPKWIYRTIWGTAQPCHRSNDAHTRYSPFRIVSRIPCDWHKHILVSLRRTDDFMALTFHKFPGKYPWNVRRISWGLCFSWTNTAAISSARPFGMMNVQKRQSIHPYCTCPLQCLSMCTRTDRICRLCPLRLKISSKLWEKKTKKPEAHSSWLTGEHQFNFTGPIDNNIFGFVLITVRMTANNDRIRPTGHQARNVLAQNRFTENRSAQNIPDRSVRTQPHLLQLELFNALFVGCNRCTFDANIMLEHGQCSINRYLIFGDVTMRQTQIVVQTFNLINGENDEQNKWTSGHKGKPDKWFNSIYPNVRENQFVFDELPNDASHFIAIHFNYRFHSVEPLLLWICTFEMRKR